MLVGQRADFVRAGINRRTEGRIEAWQIRLSNGMLFNLNKYLIGLNK
jgi:hypothetical protein